ncbi:Post-transcriptional regulator [Carnobacterium alterfunditum]|uniref:Post-transcriptional regulator n=1 Tax=Carnobacterium alterfunditum TaxID=28230 RepID=A0A1N6G9T2_9LACT|nr:post-transcriptional regulator [Carnobacterium alterfunditum]SIO04201.1 Post-transcriptional regulator [Carnobacterium alterfunditum]
MLLINESITYYTKYEPWLNLKIQEFNQLGYHQINKEDLWKYVVDLCWKRNVPAHYYQQISDIMKITPNHYLDYAAVEAQVYKVTSLDDMNFEGLF